MQLQQYFRLGVLSYDVIVLYCPWFLYMNVFRSFPNPIYHSSSIFKIYSKDQIEFGPFRIRLPRINNYVRARINNYGFLFIFNIPVLQYFVHVQHVWFIFDYISSKWIFSDRIWLSGDIFAKWINFGDKNET